MKRLCVKEKFEIKNFAVIFYLVDKISWSALETKNQLDAFHWG